MGLKFIQVKPSPPGCTPCTEQQHTVNLSEISVHKSETTLTGVMINN